MLPGRVIYPKLKTKSPIAYVLEIHDLGDDIDDMPSATLKDAISPSWTESLGGIDILKFTYNADDSKTANLDITHEVWIRRYDTQEVKQRFLLWTCNTVRHQTEKRIHYVYMSLMSQLQKTPIDHTCLSGTRLDNILTRVLAQQTQTKKITVGGLDASLFDTPTGLDNEATAWAVCQSLTSTHGGYFSVQNWQLKWTDDPNRTSKYPTLQYRKNVVGLEREQDYSESDTPSVAYQVDIVSRAEVETVGLGPEVAYIGQIVTVYDDELSIDSDLRIIRIDHRNLNEPYDIKVDIGSRIQTLIDIIQENTQAIEDLPGDMEHVDNPLFEEYHTGPPYPPRYLPGYEIQVTVACVVGDVMTIVMVAKAGGDTNCDGEWENDHGEPDTFWGHADNREEWSTAGKLCVVVVGAAAGEMARAVVGGEIDYDLSAGLEAGSEGCGKQQKPIYLGHDGKMTLTIPAAGEYGRVIGRTNDDKVAVSIGRVWVKMAKAFDPWAYDTDADGIISNTEYNAAVRDYEDGTITADEKQQVQTIYIDGFVTK